MGSVLCFGELMLRLNPEGYLRLVQADKLMASFGGGEANVSVSLANYGDDASFLSVLPKNTIGDMAINSLRKWGVDTSKVIRDGERVGIYYLEKGASQRGSLVVYDRKWSAVSLSKREDYDWDKLFEGVSWFHFTGITPALSPSLREICLDACKAAKERGITISCDLNYRGKLWTREEAKETMSRLVPYVDLLISNEADADDVFGIKATGTDVEKGKLSDEGYIDVARQLHEAFGCKMVAITLRESYSASDNGWGGMLYTDGKAYFSKKYDIRLVDRVGGGDSFGGGLIYAMRHEMDMQTAIEFAVAASCLKQTIEYDYNMVSKDEVMSLVKGNASGRVKR